MEAWKKDLCKQMPKAELHLHLDGGLEVKTALDLAADRSWADFEHPLGYEEMHRRLVIPHNLASQEELLGYFAVPGLLLHTPKALARVTQELILAKAADHVRYCEIKWAPQLHTGQGMTIQQVVETVLQAAQETSTKTGVTVRWVAVGMRVHTLEQNLAMLEAIAPYRTRGIPAVDFAGPEAAQPDALSQSAFFHRARELGFDITFHCGELPDSASRLEKQAAALRPSRIAHGPGSAESPSLCAFLRKEEIMLDLCPTSNIQAGLYPDHQSYPLKKLLKAGVPVSINTDDNVLSGLSLSDEYIRLLEADQLDIATLWQLNLSALSHAFLGESEKQRLMEEFTAWASDIPELTPQEG